MKLSDLTKAELTEKVFYLLCKEAGVENPTYYQKLKDFYAQQKEYSENNTYYYKAIKNSLLSLQDSLKEAVGESETMFEKFIEPDNNFLLHNFNLFIECGITTVLEVRTKRLLELSQEAQKYHHKQQAILEYLKETHPKEYPILKNAESTVSSYYPKYDVCRDDIITVYYVDQDGNRFHQTCKVHFINPSGVYTYSVEEKDREFFAYLYAPQGESFKFVDLTIDGRGEYWDIFNKLENM